MFYVFIFDMFNHALVFCVLLFACTSHPILYTALHNDGVVLVGPTFVVPNKSYLILSYASSVWSRSSHASNIDPDLDTACIEPSPNAYKTNDSRWPILVVRH